MKQRIAIVIFWAILIIVTIWFAYQRASAGSQTSSYYSAYSGAEGFEADMDGEVKKKLPGLPEGIGTPEDRFARLNWEKSRLVDPATGMIPENIRAKELAFFNQFVNKNASSTGTIWDKRGPGNIGGRTRAFAFDVADENIMLAGGVTGGMFRTTDGGQSWTKTTTSTQLQSVTSVAQDTRNGKTNIWYHGTGEYYAVISASTVDGSGNGIYKSTDSGQSWQLLPSTTSNTPATGPAVNDFDFVWDVVVDHTNYIDDVVFAAVINGIHRSKDGGLTWEAVLGGDTTVSTGQMARYTSITITPSGILYATLSGTRPYSGIWRSADGGDTWTQIRPAGFFTNFKRVVVAVTPQDENRLYFLALQNNHQLWKYNYLSGDGSFFGGTWANLTPNIPAGSCQYFYDFDFAPYNSQSGYDMCLAISPTDSNLVLLGGTNVYRSTDGFSSTANTDWIGGYRCDPVTPSDYVYPNHHPDQHKFLFSPNTADVLYTASDGGIHKTLDVRKDSVDWISLNNNYVTTQFYTVAIEPGQTNNNIVVGGMQDNGTAFTNSLDINQPWTSVLYGDGAYCAITAARGNYYLSWQGGKTFKCTVDDNGVRTNLTRIDPPGAGGFQFINPFILDPVTHNQMYLAASSYVWRNLDLSAIPVVGDEYNSTSVGWVRLDVSLTGNPNFDGAVTAFGMSKSDNSRLYYGSSTGKLFRLDSLQGGTITKTIITGSNFPSGYLAAISVSDVDADDVLICLSNYGIVNIFHSTDGGQSWSDVSGNLEENPDGSGNGPAVLWVSRLELPDSTVYFAGTSVGLYSTTTLGGANTTWRQEGESSIGNVVINMIQTRAFDGNVTVATHGNGMYTARYKEYTTVAEVNKPGLDVRVYPNPTANQATFRFAMPTAGNASLQVYSLEGKLVSQLVNQQLVAGEHTYQWNAGNLPSGTYMGVLRTNGVQQTVKLIISK